MDGAAGMAMKQSTPWPKSTPDAHDATVIVTDALKGKPLADDGPLKLVAAAEKRPARWVRNLVSVQVLTAQ